MNFSRCLRTRFFLALSILSHAVALQHLPTGTEPGPSHHFLRLLRLRGTTSEGSGSADVTLWIVLAVFILTVPLISAVVALTLTASSSEKKSGSEPFMSRKGSGGVDRSAMEQRPAPRLSPAGVPWQSPPLNRTPSGRPAIFSKQARRPSSASLMNPDRDRAPSEVSVLTADVLATPVASLSELPQSPIWMGGAASSVADSEQGIEDLDLLCPTLVVNSAAGIPLGIPVELLPTAQNLVMEVRDTRNMQIVLRAFVSERNEPGIMLETTDGTPVAFLDTSNALLPTSASEDRHVVLRRATNGGWDGGGTPFASIELNRANNTLVARRGDLGSRAPPLLTVTLNSSGKVVSLADTNGRLMGIAESTADSSRTNVSPSSWNATFTIRIFNGVDAGLVLCAVLAAQKLQ
mmetsp:Transcript_50978/g.110599  ORF Transcript_50978/g.110599 Transcript_50978/m.110599 type:complete len:406 (+) Transcript_50978:53-1270(+)|eukprot:CAMPEP_0170614190 /NCGR_PEP_ID=MMETSP0224-20130122/24666_1 /TAXON_ID=285029 /ORGANISM="Togula jolla, Strain CCCM 725" /LENGTH=405 /DNA_ID=CAMNT_0010939827 /DNA_START=53 /DNA_END=1270 /DNA_ORIENTATION=+